jgi:hypothetical protein
MTPSGKFYKNFSIPPLIKYTFSNPFSANRVADGIPLFSSK